MTGGQLKRKARTAVTAEETGLERSKAVARLSQVIDYLFYLIYGLLSLQIMLDLLGAGRNAGHRNFLDALCAPLLAPFNGLMANVGGSFQIKLSYVLALIVYLLLHMAVNGLLWLLARIKKAI
jgi:uncharacterized protein YggT (Ycf19 family)